MDANNVGGLEGKAEASLLMLGLGIGGQPEKRFVMGSSHRLENERFEPWTVKSLLDGGRLGTCAAVSVQYRMR